MTEFSLICAICGGAIQHQCPPQSAANLGAIQQQNGQIAQEVLTSDPAVTKDGRQPYNQGYPEEFEVFWKVYPMRKDKRKSLKAWRNAVRRAAANPREAMAQILAGAIRYRDDSGRLDEYTKYAEGWLNGDRWLDDPLPVRLGGKEPAPKTVTEDDYRRITVTELRDDMTKAIQAQIYALARLRGCPQYEARSAVQQSLAENLADSKGTTMEPYWEAMVTVAGTV